MQVFSLKMEIEELKSLLNTSYEQERLLASKLASVDPEKKESKNYSIIDQLFIETMKKYNIFAYQKLKDFTYQVQGKVISLALWRGGLFGRNGSNLVNLEEIFSEDSKKSLSPILTEKSQSPIITEDSALTARNDKSMDEEKKIFRVLSQKTFLKATKSSINKVKPILCKSPTRDKSGFRSVERKPFK